MIDGVKNQELFSDRYEVYRRERSTSSFHNFKDDSGGLIAVSKKLNSERLTSWESSREDVWVSVDVVINNKLTKVAVQ